VWDDVERRLRDAEAALRKATTKLGEAEFTRDEALKALTAERSAREAAEARLQAVAVQPVVMAVPAARKKRGRPPGNRIRPAAPTQPDTAQPVEWWIPGWQRRYGAD
jgi:hypothetical protein